MKAKKSMKEIARELDPMPNNGEQFIYCPPVQGEPRWFDFIKQPSSK